MAAAPAIAQIASTSTADYDWDPLLLKAFPGSGRPGEAQPRYLMALVENEDLWDPRNGNASLKVREAGLPYDREACRALAGGDAGEWPA